LRQIESGVRVAEKEVAATEAARDAAEQARVVAEECEAGSPPLAVDRPL